MTNHDEITNKIRKLLRLGRGSNHASEAQAAIAKAHELAAEAGVNIADIGDHDPVRVTHEAVALQRVSFERQMIHSVLITHFGVKMMYYCGNEVIYIGPEVNIELSKHIEEYLLRSCMAAWKDFKRERSLQNHEQADGKTKKSFIQGFFHAIHKTLENRPIRNDAKIVERAINFYMMNLCPKATANRQKNTVHDINAARHGIKAGETVSLNRPVNEGLKIQQLAGCML